MLAVRWKIVVVALLCSVAVRADAETQPIVTRDEVFYIPFTAHGDDESAQLALFVSGDQGASWQFYQRQPTSAGRFSFRAGVDGDFWFAVREANPGNPSAVPDDLNGPELLVIIDRVQPRLTLLGNRQLDDQIVCQWSCEDPHLALETLNIAWRTAGQEDWQPLPMDPKLVNRSENVFSGTTTVPVATSEIVQLRATVKDSAGNVATMTRAYDPTSLPVGDVPSEAIANAPYVDSMLTKVSENDDEPTIEAESNQLGARIDSQFQPDGNHEAHRSLLDQLPPAPQIARLARPDVSTSSLPNNAIPESSAGAIHGWQNQSGAAPTTPAEKLAQQLPDTSADLAETNPLIANYPSTADQDILTQTSHRTSNSRRFDLEYSVDSVSDDEIHRVEVWYSADGGRTWRHHGDDEDRKSPYRMEVDEDGVFGVRLLVQTQSGFTIRPPASGDPADVWVRVDATNPAASFSSVKYGTGTAAASLEIFWQASDENLADRPILLLYSDRSSGPWRKVTDNLPNTGRYDWPVDEHAPAQIFLRMEVTDTAGNVTTETLPMPINNQRVAPRGRINGVRPANFTTLPPS